MSKKHFEAAAAEIRGWRIAANMYPEGEARKQIVDRANGAEDSWVSIASQFNDRFDSVRFRQACRP